MNESATTIPLTTPPPTPESSKYLRHEGANDFRLVGNSCWIAVGEFVVYIRKDRGGVVAEIYDDQINRVNPLASEAEARAEAQ